MAPWHGNHIKEYSRSHPRLTLGIACIGLIVLWNLYYLVAGGESARGAPPQLTQHDKDFLVGVYNLKHADLTDADKVASILKTHFTVTHGEGQDRDTECPGGMRPTEVDTYTPAPEFWNQWKMKTHEDFLLDAAAGVQKSGDISDPRFSYTVTRPLPCEGTYASAPVAWGEVRFITAPAFSCLSQSELRRAFPQLAKDSWSTDTLMTYRTVDSLNNEYGTVLVTADDGGTCLAMISVAGGPIWGASYRAAESRFLQCEAEFSTAFTQQNPEPKTDRSSLAAAHQGAPTHDAWAAALGATIHQNCGGEPYFPELLTP